MTTHFMRSYSLLCIKTCHRRGIHAMGGMAAQIPAKNDEKANEEAFAKVRATRNAKQPMGMTARGWHIPVWLQLL
jgi:malate synthase